MDTLEKISLTAKNDCGLSKDKLLVVGVSGGADSLCLLDALHQLGYALLVAHFDHRLRPTSGADRAFVAEAARVRKLVFATDSAEVAGYASEHHLSIEEAARKLRYQFFFQTARSYDAQAVAVGHTADDQVETILMHLLRGSGLAGLKGMSYRGVVNEWDKEIPVVRPLLDTWREETHQYCAGRGLMPVEDASNQDTAYLRNRLRLELIPELENYNPQVRQAIFRMSKSLSDDWATIEGTIESAWKECLAEEGEGYVALYSDVLMQKQTGLQANLIRHAVGRIAPGMRDFNAETVKRTLSFLNTSGRDRQLSLTGKIQAKLKGDRFYLQLNGAQPPVEAWPQIPDSFCANCLIPGEVQVPGGWLLKASVQPWSNELLNSIKSQDNRKVLSTQRLFEAWVDSTNLVPPVILRRHRAGERWQPLGMPSGSIKLSDFFTNVKLPRAARAAWPVLFSGSQIAWLPGFRPGQAYQVHAGSTQVVHLELVKPD